MGLKKFTGTIGKIFQTGIVKKAAGVSFYNGETITLTVTLPFTPSTVVFNRDGKYLVNGVMQGKVDSNSVTITSVIVNGNSISITIGNNTGSILSSSEINITYYAYE